MHAQEMKLLPSLRLMWVDSLHIFRLVGEAAPGALKWIGVAAVVEALVITALPYATRGLIDSIGPAQVSGIILIPLFWLAFECALVLFRLLSSNLMRHELKKVEVYAGPYFAAKVLDKSCRVAYSNFEQPEFLDSLSRARQDASQYGVSYVMQLITIIRCVLILTGCSLLLFWIAPLWTLPVLLLAVLPSFFFDVAKARRSFVLDRKNIYRNRQAWYLDWLLTTAEPVKEVRGMSVGRWLINLYKQIHEPFCKDQVALSSEFFKLHTAVALLTALLFYLPYVVIVLATIAGKLTLGEMLFFVLAFNQCINALTQLLGSLAMSFEHHLYIRNFLQLLKYKEEDPNPEPNQDHVLNAAPEFKIENLSFSYPGKSKPVFKDLNLHIHAGETLAIIGRNGIGKTTLVKLLLGLYDYTEGKITLGGIDLASKPVSWRRDNIGVVMQDFVRYQFSIGNAVGVGWSPDAEDKEKIEKAMAMSGADEIANELPFGVNSMLGPAFGGQDISGGQWQRVALARLFMRKSRLWILDEPTSAMDPEMEEKTFKCFKQWAKDRTAILITHRSSTAKIADRIAVIDDGRVVEIGTHTELLAMKGHYARFFEIQASVFQDG